MVALMTHDALVLAGGGVAGIAWETGVLTGLQDAEPALVADVLAASTTLLGTSAGATVAAQVAAGTPLEDLFNAQVAEGTAEIAVELDIEKFGGMMAEAMSGSVSPEETRRRIGAIALAATTPSVAARRAVIEARLEGLDWTSRRLLITAVDAETGELTVFDRTSGVSLVDAVAASSAVPGVWPTVEIKGRQYMDGGIRSGSNADVAAGSERVLILIPGPETSPFGPALPQAELDALVPARVHAIFADADSLSAFGTNPLDPASRGPAALAGRELGRRVAADIARFWHSAAAQS
jgi:NTE family protein